MKKIHREKSTFYTLGIVTPVNIDVSWMFQIFFGNVAYRTATLIIPLSAEYW